MQKVVVVEYSYFMLFLLLSKFSFAYYCKFMYTVC